MKHKLKIREKIYIPKNIERRKYDDRNDFLGLVIDYVETCPFIKEDYRSYYCKHGYEYVVANVTISGHLNGGPAHVVRASDLRRYYGHDYDAIYQDIVDDFEKETNKYESVTTFSFE